MSELQDVSLHKSSFTDLEIMFIYAKAVCIHIFLIFIICRLYGTFQLNAHKDVAENITRSMTRRFIFDSNGKFSGWTSWEHYAACSTTCVKGYENQTRACCDTGNNFLCYTIPWANLTQYVGSCPEDGHWGPWTSWSRCAVTCGHGIQQRTRVCEFLPDRPHGQDCPSGEVNHTRSCTLRDCPVDGVWLQWTSWSPCSVTCGGGTRGRHRECYYLPRVPQGEPCLGAMNETNVCNNQTCPVDGVWLQWTSWSPCSVTCGGGTRDQHRDCYYQPRAPQGEPCRGAMNETNVCNNQTCPVDGHFNEWSTWSTCTVTCGGGIQSRRRTCVFTPNAPVGRNCTGLWSESKVCSTFACEPITATTITTTITTTIATTMSIVTEPLPTLPRSCFQCVGPASLCEKLNVPMECPLDKQYCINILDNKEDASRSVEMRCGTRQECESGWYSKYSTNDRCTRFDQNFVYTNRLYCEFCCHDDDCNSKINPDDKWKP